MKDTCYGPCHKQHLTFETNNYFLPDEQEILEEQFNGYNYSTLKGILCKVALDHFSALDSKGLRKRG